MQTYSSSELFKSFFFDVLRKHVDPSGNNNRSKCHDHALPYRRRYRILYNSFFLISTKIFARRMVFHTEDVTTSFAFHVIERNAGHLYAFLINHDMLIVIHDQCQTRRPVQQHLVIYEPSGLQHQQQFCEYAA